MRLYRQRLPETMLAENSEKHPIRHWRMQLSATKLRCPLPPLPANAEIESVKTRVQQRYFALYQRIGHSWRWRDKLRYQPRDWQRLLSPAGNTLMVLQLDEVDAGFFYLDYRDAPHQVELEIFGLVSEFHGQGLARPWLGSAMMYGLFGPIKCKKIVVQTCSDDHPAALDLYQKLGFSIVRSWHFHQRQFSDLPTSKLLD